MNLYELAEICALGSSEEIEQALLLVDEIFSDILDTFCKYCTHSEDVYPLIDIVEKTEFDVITLARLVRGAMASVSQNTNMDNVEILMIIKRLVSILEPVIPIDDIRDCLIYAYNRARRSRNHVVASNLKHYYNL